MKREYLNLGISILILVILGAVIGFFTTNDLEIFGYKVRAIKGYTETLSELVGTENKFEVASNQQKAKISELEQAKKSFEVEKSKYENITDETIDTIKNANKKEKYSLEYLWVKIGQYANKYKLKIGLIEPGSTETTGEREEAAEEESKKEAESQEEIPPVGEKPLEVPGKDDIEAPQMDKVNRSNYRIEAIGQYDKRADFVYAIETDETLRFKLDNLNMESAGDGIKATFEIKNLDIIK